MAKWDYKAVSLPQPSIHHTESNALPAIQGILDKMSSENWEYVGPVTQVFADDRYRKNTTHSFTALVFRRERQTLIDDEHPSG